MRKLLLLLLIPLLSGTFVLQDEYQDKIEQLEYRIEQLEQEQPLNTVIEHERNGLSLRVVVENGYIVEAVACYETCDNVLSSTEFIRNKDLEELKEDIDTLFEYLLNNI